MKAQKYNHLFTPHYMMGPNCMMLLEEMLERSGVDLRGKRVLDLGCGQGLSTRYLAGETCAQTIFAVDLWISATQMQENFLDWGIADTCIPIHADAHDLPFADHYFDAVVSLDSYHYFARIPGFFRDRIWNLVAPGGTVMICVPGTTKELHGEFPELLSQWAEGEEEYFQSCEWWKRLLTSDVPDMESVEIYESPVGDEAWQSWFDSGHEYARNDRVYMEKGLNSLIGFVSMILKKAK